MQNENSLIELWLLFQDFLDKKQVETAAEKYIDYCLDSGVDDEVLKEALGSDDTLDKAIRYYFDVNSDDDDEDEDDEEW